MPQYADLKEFRDLGGVEMVKEAGLLGFPAPNAPPTLETFTARQLQHEELPPIKWIVRDFLPAGLALLCAPSKYGKSWLVLHLCLAVSQGAGFLGYQTERTDCLYLALEDGKRRLKDRMSKLLNGRDAPQGLDYTTKAHNLDTGLLDELEGYKREHPSTGLIVIDTLQKIRGTTRGKEGAYAGDYREMTALKEFADRHNICILLVHHLRKMKDEGDVFDRISGSVGIMGAADVSIVLTREKRSQENTSLSATGRDIQAMDIMLKFNKETCIWENLGDVEAFQRQQDEFGYNENPIVQVIKRLVKQSPPTGWTGAMKDLMSAGEILMHKPIASGAKELSSKIQKLDPLLLEYDGIFHARASNGSGGGKHTFYYADTQLYEMRDTVPVPFEEYR